MRLAARHRMDADRGCAHRRPARRARAGDRDGPRWPTWPATETPATGRRACARGPGIRSLARPPASGRSRRARARLEADRFGGCGRGRPDHSDGCGTPSACFGRRPGAAGVRLRQPRHEDAAAQHHGRDLPRPRPELGLRSGPRPVRHRRGRGSQRVLAPVPARLRAAQPARADATRLTPSATDDVDLLFFPTGGGKTEAYLGLAAYTFAIRRLQGVVGRGDEARDGGAGVAVLMRYTLRLLTAQQFQRAAALICAAEVLRREDPDTWGTERFSIGLWVGQSVSPNSYTDAAKDIADARESGNRSSADAGAADLALPLVCRAPDRAARCQPDDATRRIEVFCPRGEGDDACPFSRRQSPSGLPIMTVDEEVYREPPSLLIATVDKLAQLPWYGFAGMLFGRVRARCPRHGYRHPDLDVRTGCGVRHAATGSYPAVSTQPVTPAAPTGPNHPGRAAPDLWCARVDRRAVRGRGGRADELDYPERSSHHAQDHRVDSDHQAGSASRSRAVRPRPGDLPAPGARRPGHLLLGGSRFTSRDHPGRRYLGLCAHGTRLKAAEIRLAEILLLAGQTCLDTYGDEGRPVRDDRRLLQRHSRAGWYAPLPGRRRGQPGAPHPLA